jgi:hypothetical protein
VPEVAAAEDAADPEAGGLSSARGGEVSEPPQDARRRASRNADFISIFMESLYRNGLSTRKATGRRY